MRTIRTKVYNFEELSQEAKKVAIERYRNNTKEVFYIVDTAILRNRINCHMLFSFRC